MGWWPGEEMIGLNLRTKMLERVCDLHSEGCRPVCVHTPVRKMCVHNEVAAEPLGS